MGMSKLGEIMKLFKKEDKQDVPVAIIQNGTTSQERVGIGTVATIEDTVREQKLANPAIIVIGEVVQHRQQILDIQKAYQEKGKELFEKV